MSLKWSSNLRASFNDLAKQIEDESERVIKETLLNTHNKIIVDSPVDKGTYRANNFLEADRASRDAEETTNQEERVQEAEAVKIEAKDGKTYHLYNPVPYAEELESGRSKQAPQGVYSPAAEFMAERIRKAKMKAKWRNK